MVGENTFGKNTVQQRFSLSNAGALKLTIARWLTPEGHDFGSVGVTPDVVADIEAGLPVENVVQEALAAQGWAWGYHPRNPPLHTWLLMASYSVFGVGLIGFAATSLMVW